MKDFNAPAAEAGVRAVQMQACGLVGSKSVLDGRSGLWAMLGSDQFDEAAMVSGLGYRWSTANNSFKKYPTCRWMHTVLGAYEDLAESHGIAADEVVEITIHTSAGVARDFMHGAPLTMVDAQFSFPYALAALAHKVTPAARWYDAETMARPDLLAFGGKVTAVVDPVIDGMMSGPLRRPAGRVTIKTRAAEFASGLIEYPPGSRENPMSDDEVVAKFISNAEPVLGRGPSREFARRLLALEAEASVAALLQLAVPRP